MTATKLGETADRRTKIRVSDEIHQASWQLNNYALKNR